MESRKDEFKVGPWSLVVLYIVICSILGTLLVGIIITIIKETNLAMILMQYSSDKLLSISCITTSIITVFITAIYWVIIKKFVTIDKLTIEKFIKNTIIVLTFLAIGSIVVNLYKGYNNIYTNLFTLHVACNIVEDDYRDDPEHFEGTGLAEGCKSWEDIREAEKNTLNDWIASYFITPIIPTCVNLLVSILSLEFFSHISKNGIKQTIYFIFNRKQNN